MTEHAPLWVTLATFDNAIEAHLLAGRLTQEGVESFIADQHTVWADWTMANALGGIKVQVHPQDLPRAEHIFATHQAGGYALDKAECEIRCPNCQSTHVQRDESNRRLGFLMIMLLGWFWPWHTRDWRYQCLDCDQYWAEPKDISQQSRLV